ncbi:MAG: lipid A deacylase LpxR family protein, partial [Verrucomicrobia bacterium]
MTHRDRSQTIPARSRPRHLFAALTLLLLGFWPLTATAQTEAPLDLEKPPRHSSLALRWENDTFAGVDRFYTNGVSLSWVHDGPNWLDGFADRLPWGNGRRSIGYDFGQIMTTPADTSLPVPDPADRPYMGLLYGSVSLHIEHENVYHGMKLVTGVVGPWSMAEPVQRLVHKLTGSRDPQGWDYQLKNEPILNVVYEQRRRYRLAGRPDGLALEVLPLANVMLGNVLTQAQLGGQIRFGWKLPNDFGTTLMRGMVHLPPPDGHTRRTPWRDWSVFIFSGANANFVLRDISLDGNTWTDSPSVEKEWFVPAWEVGAGLYGRHFL